MFKRCRLPFLVVIALLMQTLPSYAQSNYPNKPIKLIVGFPPGGGLDFTSRLIAPYLGEALGQQVIVENKPGAAGVIALTELARAAPDGYTLVVANIGPMVLAPNMMAKTLRSLKRLHPHWANCFYLFSSRCPTRATRRLS